MRRANNNMEETFCMIKNDEKRNGKRICHRKYL